MNNQELLKASLFGRFETVKLLINSGANVHADDDYCIKLASEKGHLETVKFLLENGANVHADQDYCIRLASRN
jgi:ankyrin repeat protein